MVKKALYSTSILLFLAALFGWLYLQDEVQRSLLSVSFLDLVLLGGIMVAYIAVQGLLLRSVVTPYGITLRFKEWFGLIVITLSGNYFVPAAGLGVRALYLSRVHGMDITSFSVSVSAIYLIELFVFGVAGLIGVLLSADAMRVDTLIFAMSLGAALLALGLLFLLPIRFPEKSWKIFSLINLVLENWHTFKKNRKVLRDMFLYTIVEFFLYASLFYYAFGVLESGIGLVDSMIYAMLSDYAFFVKFTPAGIGTYEASILYSSTFVGVPFDISLAVAVVIRLVTIVILAILTPIFLFTVFKNIGGPAGASVHRKGSI